MAEAKKVKVEFDGKKYSIVNENNPRIYGVLVEAVKDKDGNVTKYVGECSAEELAAFKDAGRV